MNEEFANHQLDFIEEIDFENDVFDLAAINPEASFKVANKIMEAQFKVTNAQWRIFWTMISLLKKDDEGKKFYQIPVKDIVEFSGLSGNDLYNRIKKEVTGLMKKVLVFKRTNGDLEFFHLVARASFLNDEKVVLVKPEPELFPFFQNLKDNYSLPKLKALLQFRVTKFGQIYLMLKQWENHKLRAFTKTLEELRFILELPNSYTYHDIKRRFLIPAERALNNTDMAFSFKPINKRVGKGVDGIRFQLNDTIRLNTKVQEKQTEKAYQLLKKYELSDYQINKIVDSITFEDIAKTCKGLKLAQINNKITTTMGAYAWGTFAKKYGID